MPPTLLSGRDRTSGLVCDQTVRLTVPKSAEAYPGEFRRVRARNPETSKNVVVLTNDFTLPALTVAELYRALADRALLQVD